METPGRVGTKEVRTGEEEVKRLQGTRNEGARWEVECMVTHKRKKLGKEVRPCIFWLAGEFGVVSVRIAC